MQLAGLVMRTPYGNEQVDVQLEKGGKASIVAFTDGLKEQAGVVYIQCGVLKDYLHNIKNREDIMTCLSEIKSLKWLTQDDKEEFDKYLTSMYNTGSMLD